MAYGATNTTVNMTNATSAAGVVTHVATDEVMGVPAVAMTNRIGGRARVTLLALFTLVISVMICAPGAGIVPKAYAANDPSTIGTIRVDNQTPVNVTSYKQLREELAKQKGKQVTVEMLCDWNARTQATSGALANAKPDARLVIPSGAKVTLNMNGCLFDRGLASTGDTVSVPSGEVILVETGATLVVNGARAQNYSDWAQGNIPAESHTVEVYKSAAKESLSSGTESFSGGLIAGGNSKDGPGGIRMQSGSTLHLNDVTIAGCRNNAGTNVPGCGGGVRMDGGNTALKMTRSTITGCHTVACGGGLYTANTSKATIDLTQSHIDKNFANQDGGGFNPGGQNVTLTGDGIGDGKSTISNNECVRTGGGIFVWEGNVKISNITLKGNRSKHGGGVYTRQDSVVLSNLLVEENVATSNGGGLYISQDAAGNSKVFKDSTAIRGCTVQKNEAVRYGGIFFDDHSNRKGALAREVSGKTIVKENKSTGGTEFENLCITANGWNAKRECFRLDEGSDVHVSYEQSADAFKVDTVFQDGKCDRYLHSDQAGYHFKFGVENRSIVRLADGQDVPSGEEVSAASINDASHKDNSGGNLNVAGKVGTVGAGGGSGNDFDLIRGFHMHDNESDLAAFYYSDGLFYGDKRHSYNEHLATLSWSMAFSGGYLNQDKPEKGNGNTYYNKHAAARQILADIGCSDQAIHVNDSMVSKPGTDSIGVAMGSKKLMKNGKETGDVLIPIIVRGIGYDDEWMSNVLLGTVQEMSPGMEAKGFSNAANQVITEVNAYLKKYNLEDELRAGKVKFWVMGYSRAGATANLTSKRLVDKVATECKGEKKSEVFGYTCEAAKGGTDKAEVTGNDYTCIHNMVNLVDVVPYVAPEQMGFKRYGVDHYIPGTTAGEVKKKTKTVDKQGSGGSGTVTTRADNDPAYTKTDAYNKQKDLMLKQLKAMDSSWAFNDYFQPRALDFMNLSHGKMYIYNNGDYKDNRVEDFVADFMRLLVVQSNISRDKYAKDPYQLNGKTYLTIEIAARNAMKIFKGSESSGFTASAKNITNFIPSFKFGGISFGFGNKAPAFSMTSLYMNVIGKWGKLSQSSKATWTNNLWEALKKTGAISKLSKDSQAKMEASFPTLLDVAFTVVDSDYNYKPKKNKDNQWAKGSNESMMYLPTFMKHSEYIVGCHAAALNIAWTRSYDSWYTSRNDLNEYTLGRPSSVDAPKATATTGGKKVSLEAGENKVNRLTGDQKIVLDNDKIVGEAVYYDLFDVTSGKQLATNQIYRGGIDFALGNADMKSYKIVTYDISYGVTSESATYRVDLAQGKHTVIVIDEVANGTGNSLTGASVGSGAGASSGAPLVVGSIPGGLLGQNDGQGAGATSRTREFTFVEGQLAVVKANVPSSKFFKNWKVSVLNANGTEVVSDVAGTLLARGDKNMKDSDNISFTMPGVEGVYPAGYQLRFTAEYGTKTATVNAQTVAPMAGQALPSTIDVTCGSVSRSCPVEWTYEDSGKPVLAPSTAYRNTAYTAAILVEQDKESEIVFADTVSVNANSGTTASSVKRNSADGSIMIVVKFEATGAETGPVRPSDYITVKQQALDLNTGKPVPGADHEYRVHPDTTITLSAPSSDSMLFATWRLGPGMELVSSSAALTDKTISVKVSENADGSTIEAQYIPVVQKIEVNLYDAEGNLFQPSGDGGAPASVEMFYKVESEFESEYEVNPEDLAVEWSPELPLDGVFATLVDYTGTVKLDPKSEDGKVRVRPKGSSESWTSIESNFTFADDFDAYFNGDDGDTEQGVSVDLVPLAVSKTFPKTTHVLALVDQPEDIFDVAFGADETKIRRLLPTATEVLTEGGFVFDAGITWNTVTVAEGAEDRYAAKRWEAKGTVVLPDAVVLPEVEDADKMRELSMSVYVDEAPYALAPTASLESGTYLYDEMVTLTTNEDSGTTYYTLDGSDPRDTANANRRVYRGESIYIDRSMATQDEEELVEYEDDDEIYYDREKTGRKAVVLKAYTEGPDTNLMQGSMSAEYEYVFADIPVPEGEELVYNGYPQVGVEWSPFYELSVKGGGAGGLRINDDGDAEAINQGTYNVTATLGEGLRWEADDEGNRPKGPQQVTFTIADDGQSPSTQTVTLKAKLAEGGTVSGGGTYNHGEVVTVSATPNTGYKFVGWSIAGGITLSMNTEYTFEVGSADVELTANFVPLSAQVFTAKWVDEDGNELDSRPYYYYEGVEDPTYYGEVPTKAGDAQYTYQFSRWVSTNEGAVTTLKPEFSKTVNTYKVTFINYDGTVLQSGNVAYGSVPLYTGITPARPDMQDYHYVFTGWAPALTKVTGHTTYLAAFDTVEKGYQVISAKKKVKKTVKLRGKSKKLKKTKTVKLKKLAKVSAQTTVTYRKANKAGGKKIVVAKNGKVKLKKGLKAGTYKVKVKLTAPANEYYKAAKPKTIVLKVRILRKK